MQGHQRLTIGVLSGWQVYEKAILLNFLGPLLRGIRSAAHDYGCNLLLACGMRLSPKPIDNRPAWPVLSHEADFVPVGPWNTDGLIVVNPLLSEARTRYVHGLIADGHPVVFIGTAQGGPAVGIDNVGGVRQALVHLVEHGHRRIAFIAGIPEDTEGDSGDRLRAYQSTVQECGLVTDPNLIAYGFHIVENGRRAMQQILDSGVSFTAVLASSDECAIGAMEVLGEAGLRIPQDVAIIGFDDLPEAVVQSPPLTSVHSPTFERGYHAFEMLLRHIEGEKKTTEIIGIPTRLIVRQSCGCLPDEMAVFDIDAYQATHAEDDAALQLAQAIAETVHAEMRRLSLEEVQASAQRLVQALVLSLEKNDPADFRLTLGGILQQAEEAQDDAHAWQGAMPALRAAVPALLEAQRHPAMGQQSHALAEDILYQARSVISESVRRQYRQYVVDQRGTAYQIASLTSQLLAALDEAHIFAILAEYLPQVGIHHAAVSFFEPEGDNPVAWSVLRAVPSQASFRFPSREFPPQGLYPADQPFSLALLPLVEEGLSGYVVFDAAKLELCGAILQQLIAAFKITRLYREATEGCRLAEEGRRLAEEANRLKSRFLSTVSHELRTPLNLILGLSEMLLLDETEQGISFLPESHRQDLGRIHASAQHLDGLIRDVLDLARNEMGQLKLICEPLDLAQALQVVAAVGEQMARDKGLGWRVEIPADLPKVWGDRTRLRQVVLNLISNAVKFTAQGEVVLQVQVGEETVTVAVIDTGLGIPVEEQEVIFDEFRQSERTTARGYGGLGLGLAICKRLVELNGGRIGVQSLGEEGAGSTFYFTLPVIEQPVARLREPLVATQRGQITLLLTERSDSSERLRKHLLGQGFEIDALWINEIPNWLPRLLVDPPGAVMLDMGMASEQGWGILKVLRENPATQDVPVLFFSLAQECDSGSVLELDYLTKPMGATDLLRVLERQGLPVEGKEERTILIVDDEPGILEMHARIVQAQLVSCRVLKARNGQEALTIIRQERPDLVLLDLMMPELDGFGVLEIMREEEIIRDIPVVVLTGQVLTEEDMNRLNRGVVAVLGKGLFTVEETLVHLELALARSRKLGSETQRLVRKAMAYLHEHYTEPISREDVAHYVGISESYLSRCFRQEVGVSLTIYLKRYRVNQAKALLTAGEKSVTEVAMAVGFSSLDYFGRVFRQEVGMSPSAYKRTH